MTDTIVYTLVSKGGGIDGLDHTDKGGNVIGAHLSREQALAASNAPWADVKPEVIDLYEVARNVVTSMDPVSSLALSRHPELLMKKHPKVQTTRESRETAT